MNGTTNGSGTTNSVPGAPSISTRAALLAARKLIEKPENWARGWYAYDENRNRCGSLSADAVCWCAVGAIHKVTGTDGFLREHPANDLFFRTVRKIDPSCDAAHEFNDSYTHADVLAAFDKAIAAASVLKNDDASTTEERAS